MRARLLPAALLLALAAGAHAAQLPEAGKKDARIRFATYDPYDVVTIYTRVGLETHIVLDPAERIVDITGGDVDAWGVATRFDRNGVFLKPAGQMPDANLHIVTNKRTYSLDLKLADQRRKEVAFMTVYFRYPEAARAADAGAKEAAQVRALLDAGAGAASANRRYTVQGSSDLAPVEAWDDGRTTFLRFRARAGIPAIYSTRDGDDALEQIENVNTRDDVVQVQGVRRKLVLRIGRQVACVFNEGFDSGAARAPTNTASPKVKRTLKGATP